MQANYEQIVKAHQTQPGHTEMHISDEMKFQVVMEIVFLLEITANVITYMICIAFAVPGNNESPFRNV